MACGNSARGTESLTVEFQAGDNNAVQLPLTKIRKSKVPGPPILNNISTVSNAPNTACTANATRISRRRSMMSAHTPAGNESKNIGRNTAVCTSAAKNEEPEICTIIQLAAMVCMALPMK